MRQTRYQRMRTPRRRTIYVVQRATSWTLLIVFSVLSFFGMGLHGLLPNCGDCACHESCSENEAHENWELHSAPFRQNLQRNQAGLTQFSPGTPEMHEADEEFAAHANTFCPICHFCQMSKALTISQPTVQDPPAAEKNVLFASILHACVGLFDHSCRAPPAIS